MGRLSDAKRDLKFLKSILEKELEEAQELTKWYSDKGYYKHQLSKIAGIKRMIFYTESFIQTEIRKRHADRLFEVLHTRFPKYHSGYKEIMREIMREIMVMRCGHGK